eukprot:7884002-Pyramimonas_sp.AAC.1
MDISEHREVEERAPRAESEYQSAESRTDIGEYKTAGGQARVEIRGRTADSGGQTSVKRDAHSIE